MVLSPFHAFARCKFANRQLTIPSAKKSTRRTSSNTRLSRSAQANVLDEYEAVFSIFLTLREELLPEKYIQDIKNRLRRSLLHELLSFVQCSSSGGFNTFSRITWLTASEDLRKLPLRVHVYYFCGLARRAGANFAQE